MLLVPQEKEFKHTSDIATVSKEEGKVAGVS